MVPLRLAHVSDIHFRGYQDGWEYDRDQRDELLRDVRQLVDADGSIDGILVGGDIAFRAAPEEYKVADEWLDALRDACGGLDSGRVWTVPGNHDVDRRVIGSSDILQRFRTDVRECATDGVDELLRQRLSIDQAATGLIAPLQAYNTFAGEYQCAVTCAQPHWSDASLEFDGLTLALLGLNSVLISDRADSDLGDGTLVLGRHQCMVSRADDTVHLAIAHHPPGWVRDWDRVDPYLRRAHVLVFGHEHAYAARQIVPRGTVEVYGGAVGPDRSDGDPDGDYAPTYNVLTLERRDHNTVVVTVQPRYWNHARTSFGAHPDGPASFEVDLAQPPMPGPMTGTGLYPEPSPPDNSPPPPLNPAPSPARSANQLAPDAETTATHPPAAGHLPGAELRRIGTQYMRRSWPDRVRIARALDVVADEDLRLSDAELFPLLLRRIRDRGLIERLSQELQRG